MTATKSRPFNVFYVSDGLEEPFKPASVGDVDLFCYYKASFLIPTETDLIEPIRPNLCHPVGESPAAKQAMAVASVGTSAPQRLRAHISSYNLTPIIETVDPLYFDASRRAAGKLDCTPE